MRTSARLATSAAAAALAGLLASGLLAAPAAASDVDAQALSSHQGWTVVRDPLATTVVWKPADGVPFGDARVEFALDGETLGIPRFHRADQSLRLTLPQGSNPSPRRLSAVAAGRVLDGFQASRARAGRSVAAVQRPSATVARDPGRAGRHKVVNFRYSAPGVRVGGFLRKTEVRGEVFLPDKTTAPGKRPLVVFLHGRHTTCYDPADPDFLSIDWPCPSGTKQVPSYRGYRYVQKLLASQGYATVSISANGVNGQDWEAPDAGAGARSELIRHHLKLLKGWSDNGGSGDLRQLKGRIKVSRTLLVGHSRGGEGANRATVDLARSGTYKIAGQVLIAPTDFGFQVAPGVPTAVILPYCDGDVYDLQGQAYVDQGRYVAGGDRAAKSAVMMLGANHNFYNTEWTPGQSRAPAWDDWSSPTDPACGTDSAQRLTAKQQQAAGATYIAAAARALLSKDTVAAQLLDGSAVRAASAGKAVVLSAGYGGTRKRVFSATEKTLRLRTGSGSSAHRCAGGWGFDLPSCQDIVAGLSPHWLSHDVGRTPWDRAVHWKWEKRGARLKLTMPTPRNLGSGRRVDLRVVATGAAKAETFDVILQDARGRTVRVAAERDATALPAFDGGPSRLWAQTVRFATPKTIRGFDRTRVVSITLVSTSGVGEVFVLDAFTSRPGAQRQPRPISQVPRFTVRDVKVSTAPTPSGVVKADVTVSVSGTSDTSSRVWVEVIDESWNVSGRAVKVRPGTTSFTVPVSLTADGVFSRTPAESFVTVTPLRNAATRQYLSHVTGASSTSPPKLDFATPHVEVTQGQVIRWTGQLDGLTRDGFEVAGSFQPPDGGLAELTAGTVPRSWFLAQGVAVPPSGTPLSESGVWVFQGAYGMATTVTVELPTAATPKLSAPRHVRLVIEPDGVFTTTPFELTATIHPSP